MKLKGNAARLLLLLWLITCFVASAITTPGALLAGMAIIALAFRRRAVRPAKRALCTAVPLTLAILLLTWAYARWILHHPPDLQAYSALLLRTMLIAWWSFAVMETADLLSALAPWPTFSRLLVLTLAQIHSLRLLVRESWLGLQSRLPRKPSVRDGLANASGVTATMVALSARNARDIADALRSRGF